MFTRIDLEHFKCFTILKLPLRPLTLLSGVNASGKSSVLQALALLHQTIRDHEWSSCLMLNGSAVNLGTVADVVDQVHGRRSMAIALLDDETPVRWGFTGDHGDMTMDVTRATVVEDGRDDGGWESSGIRYLMPWRREEPDLAKSLARRLGGLTYLTAERQGPREMYPLIDIQRAPVVGVTGEHAVSVLYAGGDEQVLEKLAADGAPPTRLRQTEKRMASFFPGCDLELRKVRMTDVMTMGLRTAKDTAYHRPVHTGFGLTQVFPIVVAALSAKKNDLLLIENPEVHLHPAGQARMGEFLAEVASAGVQVILETHSDHVLNGIRRAVKNQMLPAESVALHFFRPRSDDDVNVAQVESPCIDGHGRIDSWPEGFFDQFDRDMDYFAGWA